MTAWNFAYDAVTTSRLNPFAATFGGAKSAGITQHPENGASTENPPSSHQMISKRTNWNRIPTCRREPSGLPDFPRSKIVWVVFLPRNSTVEDAEQWMAAHGLKFDPYKGQPSGFTDRGC
jgi:hypothetical protein